MSETHTARAAGTLPDCPDLAILEAAPLAPNVYAHVDVCDACQLVIELLATPADCVPYEPLLAMRADGELGRAAGSLLDRHLGDCSACRSLADALGPPGTDFATLPQIDPRAYTLGNEVARGGMGRILAARDLRVGRPVAIKELLGRSPGLAARFEREARVTARLQHPGIVPIYEIGRWPDDTPFYSMRLVDGRTLREAIDAASTLAARLGLLSAVIAATEAVAFAHAQRIIHRDLTPANVLVGAYGETVVIDWGLAKDLSSADDAEPEAELYRSAGSLTSAGAVMGTAAYMPPEQASASPVDERADVYALGAILYHLLAGRAPYRGRRTDELIAAVKAAPPPAIEELAPDAPRDLVSIVHKAMARDPAARYPSARELADELKRFQTGRLVEAHLYTTFERMKRFVARNRAPLVVTAIAAITLAAFAVIAVRRVVREKQAAQDQVIALLEDRGRNALLDGDSLGALAYLDAAYESGRRDSAPLRFLLALALRDVSTVDGKDLDCAPDVRFLTFSPDASAVVVACHDRAKIFRLEDHAELRAFGPFKGGFDEVIYSHDGKILATWGEEGVARLWDVESGRLLQTLRHGDSMITFVTFGPDDRIVSTAGYDGWARIWDAHTGGLVRSIRASTAPIFHHLYGVLSQDGKRMLTVTIEGIGAGFDVATGERVGGFEHGSFVAGGRISPDGTRAVTCGGDRLVKIWDAKTNGALIRQLAGSTTFVWRCLFSPDGARVLGGTIDGHAFIWDAQTGAALVHVMHGSNIWNEHFSDDGERFVTIGVDGSVKVWDAQTGGLLAAHDTQGGKDAAFSPDGRRLVAARGDGRIRIWTLPNGPLRATFAWHADASLLAVTRDGTRAALERDGIVQLHDVTTGAALGPPLAAPIATSADGTRIAARALDGTLVVLDARDAHAIAMLHVPRAPSELAVSDDGHRVLVAGGGAAPEVWDVDRGVRLATLVGAAHGLLDPTGARALGWAEDGAPAVWDVDRDRTGVTLLARRGMTASGDRFGPRPIGFGDGGRVVVLDEGAPDDRTHTTTIWDAETGLLVHAILGTTGLPALSARGDAVSAALASRGAATYRFAERVETAFSGEPLQRAELDPSGALVAAIDNPGTAALVLDAHDGRVLARWPIAHDVPSITQEKFAPAHAAAMWTRDGRAIVTRSTRVAVWSADIELPAQVERLVHRYVPWQVEGGHLVPALARLHGRVVRGGAPVASAAVDVEFRKPPELGPEVTWQRRQAAVQSWQLRADSTGAFALEKIAPGSYTLTVGSYEATATVSAEDDEVVIDLAATRARAP